MPIRRDSRAVRSPSPTAPAAITDIQPCSVTEPPNLLRLCVCGRSYITYLVTKLICNYKEHGARRGTERHERKRK